MVEKTTIEIRVETWQRLNGMKTPGESFDDVITRVLEDRDGQDA